MANKKPDPFSNWPVSDVPPISFEDFVTKLKLDRKKQQYFVEQFKMSPNIKSLFVETRTGPLRVMRPDDV